MTAFGDVPVHVEFFKNPEQVIEEKAYLLKALKSGGVSIINRDDKNFDYFKSLCKGSVLSYGFDPSAELQASHASLVYVSKYQRKVPDGITFKVNHRGSTVPVFLHQVMGNQHVYPVLAAFAVG